MTRLFIRIYVSVLVVLVASWYLLGTVLQARSDADFARVVEKAHSGGARLLARDLDTTPFHLRDQLLIRVRKQFNHPVEVLPVGRLPTSIQRRLFSGADVCYYCQEDGRPGVVAALSGGSEVVFLGPFPDYTRKTIEDALGGWMRLTASRLAPDSGREATLAELQTQFEYPVVLTDRSDLPEEPRARIDKGEDIVFYGAGNGLWLAVTPLADGAQMVRFGPFPSYERNERKAMVTTLALLLIPSALVIALLLRPVARQLRQLESAAEAIAAGDLSARVDERRIRAIKRLAQAFNHMAGRTEGLVRTQRELLQAVSHELSTPLSRMRFAIELIETAKDHGERKLRLGSLDSAVADLDALVEELLRYVSMETAAPQLNKEPLAVEKVLQTLVPKHTVLHPSVQFRISDQSDEDQAIVFADRLSFQRVMDNLLGNAGRFARCKVSIAVESSDAAITIDVDDDGCGIPESERERVFEPFVRLGDRTGNNHHGVGLGLALVQRIMTQHGGRVEALTSPMGGCRIRTTWPAPG
jgi:two-component system, OmpR family, sensor histidine kinase RstB